MDESKRHQFYKIQKNYKKLLKQKRRTYEEELMSKLENLYHQNKEDFWKFLKSLKTHTQIEELPSIENLINHFQNLYTKTTNYQECTHECNYENGNSDKFDSLNNDITREEVEKTIKNLKSKKAPGYDRITNEMIKCTNALGIKLITTLFNKILKSGIFPEEWNYGLIRPIHKGLDKHDANNYRGITLNSCLGKLFCTIFYNRLNPLLEKENIYCKEQAGFRKDHRTTDHIFLLREIIKKYTTKNKILYTCFVDFSKAFDSICRQSLMEKLQKIGINGYFLQIIKSIYETTTNSLIYNESISKMFTSNIGVKQGDTLSTILFNLYINDLPKSLICAGNNPIYFNNIIETSCLKYADDLVLMSTSKDGLQKCLDNLESYCTKWKLEINMEKTKVILFNRQGSLIKKHKFTYKLNHIDIAREYKYLGFIFTCSGSTNAGITNLINQAKKAWFSIQYYLSVSKNKNIDIYLKLFDSKVKPILLYACEAWADTFKIDSNITNLLLKNKLEKFQITVLKQLLGVSQKTTNISVLLELGRYPISINIQYQAIKYFLRFSNINKDRLLFKAYEDDLKTYNENTNFISYIIKILNNIGMSNIWLMQLQNRNPDVRENESLMKNILTRLRDIFVQLTFDQIQNTSSGKLKFLNSLKDTYRQENYLKIQKLSNRRALTKLRTSNHNLAIETGRWTQTDRNDRLCTHCTQSKIEDEIHFLFDCPKHSDNRKTAFTYIKNNTDIDLRNDDNRINNLKQLFNSNNINSLNALGKYVKLSFEQRNI